MPSILNATTTSGLVTSADNSGSLQLQTNNGTTAVTIDTSQNVSTAGNTNLLANGNVGIGTSNPAALLSFGSFASGSSDGARIFLRGNTNEFAIGTNGSQNVYAGFQGHVWQTGSFGGTERMRITSGGDLLVATTTAASSLGFSGTPKQTVSSGVCVTDGTNRIILNGQENGSTIYPGLYFNSSSMRVYNGSNTGVYLNSGSTSWTATSDERVKDIIEPISDAANKVSTLRAVIGKYKTDEENVRRSFLIAQDVQAVLPEAVSEGDGGYLGVQYTDTIPLLVAAIQEQQAQIEELKAEVQALKGVS